MRASKWANERLIYLSFEKKLHYTLEGFIMIFVIYGRPVVCRVWLCFHLSDARTYIFSHSVRIFWFNIWISFNAGRQCLLHFFFFFFNMSDSYSERQEFFFWLVTKYWFCINVHAECGHLYYHQPLEYHTWNILKHFRCTDRNIASLF